MSFCPATVYENLSATIGAHPAATHHDILTEDLVRLFTNELDHLGIHYGEDCEHSISDEAFMTLFINFVAWRVIDDERRRGLGETRP